MAENLEYSGNMFIFETMSRRYWHSKKQKNTNSFAFYSFIRIFAGGKVCHDALDINRQ